MQASELVYLDQLQPGFPQSGLLKFVCLLCCINVLSSFLRMKGEVSN